MKSIRPVIAFCYLLLMTGACDSPEPQAGTNTLGDTAQTDLSDAITPIIRADTIVAENAPRQITRKIRTDQDGHLLFAAYGDIIRYDGQSFTTTPIGDGEPLHAFDALEDRRGITWIASNHFGVFHHDGRGLSQFLPDDGLGHERTICLLEDRSGHIWIATQRGLSRFDGTTFRTFTEADGLTHVDVNTITEDRSGKIWVGTRGSVFVHDPDQEPGTQAFEKVVNLNSEFFANIWSIVEDRNGDFWFGGQAGLWRYRAGVFSSIRSESITYIHEDGKGNLWLTSPAGILFRIDSSSLTSINPFMETIFRGNEMFFGIGEDKNGHIWVGHNRGVLRYTGKHVHYFKDPSVVNN